MPEPASPDVELLLTRWARATLPDNEFGTEAPSNLADVLPWHRVTRLPGTDIELTLERALIDVDSFAADRTEASDAARALKDAMTYKLPGLYVPDLGAAIGAVRVVASPAWRAWDNTNVRRYGATYLVVVHAVPIHA